MEEYRKLGDLVVNSSTDVVLEYIRSNNINAAKFAELSNRFSKRIHRLHPLGLAIKHGHLLVVNELISRGFDPNSTFRFEDITSDPIHLAWRYNRSWIMDRDHGISIDSVDRHGDTVLVCALSKTLDVVKTLVDAGASVNIACRDGRTPLSTAIDRQNKDACRYLISKGADVNARNKEEKDRTHMMHALKRDVSIDILRLLVEYVSDVNAYDNEKKTILMYATNSNAGIDFIRLLLEYGADVNALDINNKSPLRYAIESRQDTMDGNTMEKIVNMLLKFGADVNVLDNQLVSPLMHAVKKGVNIDVIRLLVTSGADVNASDSEGLSLLIHSFANRIGTDVNEFLLESGADVNVLDKNKNSPLCYILQRRFLISDEQGRNIIDEDPLEKQVKLLVKFGADVNSLDNNLISPLMHAVWTSARLAVIRLLVESGADVNASDSAKMSPLIYAFASNIEKPDVIEFLLESGADVNALDEDRNSPLCYAMQYSSCSFIDYSPDTLEKRVKLLVKFGADVNVLNNMMVPPLMQAVRKEAKLAVIRLLVESGADVNFLDNVGNSAVMYVLKQHAHADVLLLFIEYGVDVRTHNTYNKCPLSFVLEHVDSFTCMIKENGECINLVQMFVEAAADVKGLLDTLPRTRDFHNSFDVIRTLCSRGADIGAKDETGNTILHQVMTKTAQCCCSKCFNLVHYCIVELNMSLWARNSNNETPFRCIMRALENRVMEPGFRRKITGMILKLCVQVGYIPNSSEMAVVRQSEARLSMDIKGSDVTSLQDICCFSVRRALGRRLPAAVTTLPIPEKLKQYVKLTHCHPIDETPGNVEILNIPIVPYFDSDSDEDEDEEVTWNNGEYEDYKYELTDTKKQSLLVDRFRMFIWQPRH